MLGKLFEDRSTRRHSQTRFFRPRLEALEQRLALDGSMFPGTTPTYGPSVPTNATSATPDSEGQFAFNSLLAFGLPPSAYALYALGGAPVSGYVAVPYQQANNSNNGGGGGGGAGGNPLVQLQNLTTTLYEIAAFQNLPQANALVSDEIFRGLDTYVSHIGQELGLNNLMQGNITAYQNAINQNPLEQGEVGQLLGALVFDLSFYLADTGQFNGF